ncbi:MAG: hypothetical protein H7145_14170 [Akkermansiaceae bacterium]|nr:hypothetical protein [Armatimonadota bacterium]
MSFPLLLSRRALILSTLVALSPLASYTRGAEQEIAPPPSFTDAEREAVRIYWNGAGRYTILPSPDAAARVNVTVEGSTWYLAFTKIIAACRKTDPITAAIWQSWWDQRAAMWKAIASDASVLPLDPGPAPQGLENAVGSPCPPLYEKVAPTRYTVTFALEDAPAPFIYEDGIDFGKRNAYYSYYRQKNGVIRPGKRVRDATGDEKKRLEAIFAKAGRTDFERRVLQAVSQYEGGFEAINTYDTGFVSVGFIQFITASDGTGSLAGVLQRYKTDDPANFQKDFRRFGIDVSSDSGLVCVNTATGAETRGADAVRQVIDDKRLTAVFERAAAFDGFRLAQVAVARSQYWPADDTFPVGAGTVRVGDVVRSEAGMATLMDKKVNRGNIRDFADVAGKIMTERGLTDTRDLSKYERSLIAAMKYRGDFLADKSLSQPSPEPVPVSSPVPPPSPIVSKPPAPKPSPSASPAPTPSPVASPVVASP